MLTGKLQERVDHGEVFLVVEIAQLLSPNAIQLRAYPAPVSDHSTVRSSGGHLHPLFKMLVRSISDRRPRGSTTVGAPGTVSPHTACPARTALRQSARNPGLQTTPDCASSLLPHRRIALAEALAA